MRPARASETASTAPDVSGWARSETKVVGATDASGVAGRVAIGFV